MKIEVGTSTLLHAWICFEGRGGCIPPRFSFGTFVRPDLDWSNLWQRWLIKQKPKTLPFVGWYLRTLYLFSADGYACYFAYHKKWKSAVERSLPEGLHTLAVLFSLSALLVRPSMYYRMVLSGCLSVVKMWLVKFL